MGEGGWCPSGLCAPSLPSVSSPWYLSCQQEKVTMLFFSPPVLPSCPSPNLSYLTLILTCGFGPGSGGVCVGCGRRFTSLSSGLWRRDLEILLFSYCPLSFPPPMPGQSLSSFGFTIRAVWGWGGWVLACREPLVVPRSTQKPQRSQGLWGGGWGAGGEKRGRVAVPLPMPMSHPFVLSSVVPGCAYGRRRAESPPR